MGAAVVQAMQAEEGGRVASWQRTLWPCALGNFRLGTLRFPVPALAWPREVESWAGALCQRVREARGWEGDGLGGMEA